MKTKKNIILFTMLTILVSLLSIPNKNSFLTKNELEWLKNNKKTVKYSIDSDFFPIEYLSGNKKHMGFSANYLKVIEKVLGIKFEYVYYDNWSEVIEKIKEKQIDIIPAIIDTPQKKDYLYFTSSYISYKTVIVNKIEDPVGVSIVDLKQKKVAALANSAILEFLYSKDLNIELIPVSNMRVALRLLSFGEVDFVVMEMPTATHLIKDEGIVNVKLAGELDFDFNLAMGIRKDLPMLYSIISKTINNLSPQFKDSINTKWLDKHTIIYRNKDFWECLDVYPFWITCLISCICIVFLIISIKKKEKKLLKAKDKISKSTKKREELLKDFSFLNSINTLFINGTTNRFFVKNKQLEYINCNNAFADDLNLKPDEVIGKTDFDLFNITLANKYQEDDKRILVDLQQVEFYEEYEYRQNIVTVKVVKKPYIDANGKCIGILGSFVILNDPKYLKDTDLIKDKAIYSAIDGVVIIDFNNKIRYVNKAATKIFGKNEIDLIKTDITQIWYEIKDFMKEVDALGSCKKELKFKYDNSHEKNIYVLCSLVKNENNKTLARTFILEDVSDKNKTEKELFYKSKALEQSKNGILITSIDRKIIYANKAWAKIHGYTVEEIINIKDDIFYDKSQINNEVTPFFNVVFTNGSCSSEIHHKSKNGNVFVAWMSGTLLKDKDNEAVGIVQIVDDISDIKKVENQLEKRLKYEEALSECSKILLLGNNNINLAIQKSLDVLVKSTEADRVYVFENYFDEFDGLCMRQTYESCNYGAKSQLFNPELQHYPYAKGLTNWVDTFFANDIINVTIEDVNDLSKIALEKQNIKSLLAIPIWINQFFYGFIGFDNTKFLKKWDDETVRLLRTVADMIAAFLLREKAQEELHILNTNLEKIVFERTKQLNKTKEQAEIASKAKSEFLAHMSHEIRTPLNLIMGYSDLLKTTSVNEIQNEYLGIVKEGGELLATIIDDILDISKIENGEMELENIKFNLEEIINSVIKMFKNKIKGNDIELYYLYDESLYKEFLGDPTRIRQILLNLVGNAVKFTKQGEIVVKVSLHEDVLDIGKTKIKVEVVDTGIGIKKNMQDKIFGSFTQADSSITRKYGGTGLGLSITKTMVEKMGGRIWIESTEGKGSSFAFIIELKSFSSNKKGYLSKSVLNMKPIIVGVNENSINALLSYLNMLGFKNILILKEDGQISPEILKEDNKIFIINIAYKNFNALEFVKLTKKRFLNSKFIALSTEGIPGWFMPYKKAGFDGFFTKPILHDDVFKIILSFNKETKEIPAENDLLLEEKEFDGVSVLVVDDNQRNLDLTSSMLESLGCKCYKTISALEALEVATVKDFELCFMDLRMPNIDGFEATKMLKEVKNIDVIALTADVRTEIKDRAFKEGMIDYVTKPVTSRKIRRAILAWKAKHI